MIKFRSLTAKYCLISFIFSAFVAALIYAGYVFTLGMAGNAERINAAGSLRYLSLEIALHLHQLSWTEDPGARQALVVEINRHVAGIDKTIDALKYGDSASGIRPIDEHPEARAMLERIGGEWTGYFKPAIFGMTTFSREKAAPVLAGFDNRVQSLVAGIDTMTDELARIHDSGNFAFRRQMVYAAAIFLAAAAIITLYMRRTVVLPVRRLREAAQSVERGEFGVGVNVTTGDDVGELGRTFNAMSWNLANLFDENRRHLREQEVLNAVSAAASSSLKLDEMLDKILRTLLSLEPLSLEKKGAIFLADEKSRHLALAASLNFGDEQNAGCSRVPYGECLCGICADTGENVFSTDNTTDKRHTKVYGDAKEHGHIILPLMFRGKTLGVLCLYMPRDANLSPRDIALYQSIADILSVAMQNSVNHMQVAMLAQSLESSTDVIIITDLAGNMIHVNPETTRQLGYREEELTGRNVSIVQSTGNIEGLGEEIYRKTLEGGWFGEVMNVRKDGSEYPVYLTTSPVRDEGGNIIAMIGVARDITERKRMEEKLREYADTLEEKVRVRTAELEESRRFAEAASRAKSDFLANVSHELRTPLNSVIGFSEVLRDGLAGEVTAEQREYLQDIWESGKHLLRVINDILNLSKIEAGKMTLDPGECDPHVMIGSCLMLFREKALKHRISLQTDVSAEMGVFTADEIKIKQVILNLLANAFKFTADGGKIGVRAKLVDDENVFEVWDTGIGIAPGDISRLFRPFEQLESTLTKKYEGTGLGLNICKQFVELHGGRIWVESEVGKGSRFFFAIPARVDYII